MSTYSKEHVQTVARSHLAGALTAVPQAASNATHPGLPGGRMGKANKAVQAFAGAVHWVLISKVVENTGYSDDAIRAKKARGEWIEEVHWRKGPDNRLVFNLLAIQNWMGGCDA